MTGWLRSGIKSRATTSMQASWPIHFCSRILCAATLRDHGDCKRIMGIPTLPRILSHTLRNSRTEAGAGFPKSAAGFQLISCLQPFSDKERNPTSLDSSRRWQLHTLARSPTYPPGPTSAPSPVRLFIAQRRSRGIGNITQTSGRFPQCA